MYFPNTFFQYIIALYSHNPVYWINEIKKSVSNYFIYIKWFLSGFSLPVMVIGSRAYEANCEKSKGKCG